MNTTLDYRRLSTVDMGRFTIWVLCGVIGGVVAGVVSRLSMRGVALAAGMEPGFSIGGTLGILIFGAIMGIPFALIFAGVRRFIPLPERWKGLAYGVILGILFVVAPFLFFAEGELDLIPPSVGILLFIPLPLIFGFSLTIVEPRLDKHYETQTQQVNVLWLVALGIALIFSLNSMEKLISRFPLVPQGITQFYKGLNFSLDMAAQVHNGLMVGFMLAYIAFALFIFWRGVNFWVAKFTALTLLVMASAFFTRGIMAAESMNALPVVKVYPVLVRTLAWSMFMVFTYIFPDGRFTPRWTRWMTIVWVLVFLAWFTRIFEGTPVDPGSWPILLQVIVLLGAFVSGVVAQVIRYWHAPAEQKIQTRLVVLGISLTFLFLAILWVSIALYPWLMVGGRIDFRLSYLFSFSPYLLPWLCTPASLALAIWRYGLWENKDVVEGEALISDQVSVMGAALDR
jgi:hypothetical protein